MKLTTKSLAAETQHILSPVLPGDFRYFKSYNHFRKQFSGGLSYLSIDAVTHNQSIYYLAFYLGVRIDALERYIKSLWDAETKLDHYARSIWCYTINIGPSSPHWSFPIFGLWTFQNLDDVSENESSIRTFVEELAIPYLLAHERPEAIRETLLKYHGRAQNVYPYEQILTLDLMGSENVNLESDLVLLEERYANHIPEFRERFYAFRDKILLAWQGGV
jgi:hypothetical protein